ncbi:nmrA-like family domain-containing protein 1 isoform X1 [Haliotis rubra]|uniref:nmrA-like family domain-containing protein 1 isoform X1 n=1 Tax=Haliotis rubra TaxID=36100 RepID=UPI001EE629EF|nr:nmrA-like family domain-containing protein 1 isoform X1 [Haliotis rubra]XP_046563290.1 nmrA-like family domain-containing protein 1 isoform X1 [Haliotis rubra]
MPEFIWGCSGRSDLFSMGCGASVGNEEDPLKVVVFGALGMVGGAVASALVKSPRVKVIAITRTPTSGRANELAEKGAVISTADLNDPRSLERVFEGAHAVFLTTHYWEHFSKEKEITQGTNAIDAAVSCNIRHLVLYGSEAPDPEKVPECGPFEAKAELEEYLMSQDIPYTLLRMPFFYENLLTIFKPHRLKEGKYAIALPLEGDSIDCMSVSDMGRCVLNIFLKPKPYLGQTVNLAIDRITAKQMADMLTKHMHHIVFVSPLIGIEDYANFKFSGAKDLAAMFQHYRTVEAVGDIRATKKLCGTSVTFDRWVIENTDKIMLAMKEDEEL